MTGTVVGASALLFVVLGVRLNDVRKTRLDTRIADWAYRHIHGTAAELLLGLAQAPVSLAVVATVLGGAVLSRSWRVAVWGAITPVVAVVLAEDVFKPLVHRPLGNAPGVASFPSGHATALASALLVLAVLVVRSSGPVAVRIVCVAGLAVWYGCGSLGLVRNFQHYPSDAVGSFLLAVPCVLGGALVVDAVAARSPRVS